MRTLIVSVAKTGHVNQCHAFCEAAGWTPDAVELIPSPARMTGPLDRLVLNARKRIAIRRAAPRTRSPGRLRIVASGGAAEPVVAAYRALFGTDVFAVFSGRPRWRDEIFDVALVGRHAFEGDDPPDAAAFPAARTTVLRLGVMTRRIQGPRDADAPAGLVALIGGLNKAFKIDPARIASQLAALSERRANQPLTIAFSRRTMRTVESRLRAAFAGRAVFVDRSDRAGFEAAMAGADGYAVTPDSLTMTCEACATGRPVTLFDLECFDPSSSTARFARDLLSRDLVASATGERAAIGCPPGLFDPPSPARDAYDIWASDDSDGQRRRIDLNPR
jgi:mitochondrial fission protein ELM1